MARAGAVKLFFVGYGDCYLMTEPVVVFDDHDKRINDLNRPPNPKGIA